MKVLTLLVGALALAATQLAWSVEISGVKLDEETTVATQKLVLNGAGIRYKYFVQVYVCALYLPKKETTLKDITALPGVKHVSVTMLREISSDDLGDALLTGIRKNSTPDQTQKIGFQLVKLGELFSSIPKLKKGDNFTLDYVPPTGTIISVNGKQVLDALPDEAFFDAILRIWMGDNPADAGLKPALLGQKKEATPNYSNNTVRN